MCLWSLWDLILILQFLYFGKICYTFNQLSGLPDTTLSVPPNFRSDGQPSHNSRSVGSSFHKKV